VGEGKLIAKKSGIFRGIQIQRGINKLVIVDNLRGKVAVKAVDLLAHVIHFVMR